jgi:hypothetical protein
MAGVRCAHIEDDDPMVSAAPITAQSIAPATSVHGWQTDVVDPLEAACGLWRHTRVNEGRIRLERTSRAIDSDILSAMDGKAPEYSRFHNRHAALADRLDINRSIIPCLDA